jgi:hypothetical protein
MFRSTTGPRARVLPSSLPATRLLSVTESSVMLPPNTGSIGMPEYRAYILYHDGHIKSFEPLVCPDDDVAILHAKRLVDGHDVELWQGTRRVTTLPHGGPPPIPTGISDV